MGLCYMKYSPLVKYFSLFLGSVMNLISSLCTDKLIEAIWSNLGPLFRSKGFKLPDVQIGKY